MDSGISSLLLNLMVIIVETFMWGRFGAGDLYAPTFAVPASATALLLLLGPMCFSRSEARTGANQ